MHLGADMLRVVLVLAMTSTLGAVDVRPRPKPEAKPSSAAIHAALEKYDTFDFVDVTFSQVVTGLREQFKVPILFDRMAMTRQGLEPEAIEVRAKFGRTTFKNALRAMLQECQMTYVVIGGELLITTPEMAIYRQLTQRVRVDVHEVPLQKAIRDLAESYGAPIVVDPRIIKSKAADAVVSLKADDVPLEAAVRLLCELADLKPARLGNVLYITTEERAAKLKDGDKLVELPPAPPARAGLNLGDNFQPGPVVIEIPAPPQK